MFSNIRNTEFYKKTQIGKSAHFEREVVSRIREIRGLTGVIFFFKSLPVNYILRSPDDKLRWAFKMYDEDNSREVDVQEMENVMVVSKT